jgi:two-component system response regulator YesN
MIHLLIIDDEEEIRMGISHTIEWEAHGINICGLAENGKEAIEKIELFHPEIILLDIRMPVINGLQVLEYIKSHHYTTKSIILSGYDDFSYAQTAIKNGASDFLLKPCQPQEILETVLKIKSQVDEETKESELLQGLKVQFNENLPLLKEIYLTKLIKNDGRLKLNFSENAKLYKINLTDTNISTAVIRIDDTAACVEQNSSDDVELFKFAVKNITNEILSSKLNCEVFQSNDEIIALYNDENKDQLFELLEEVQKNIMKYFKFSISIGVGTPYTSINNLRNSYTEALKSSEAAFFIGCNSIIKYDDIKEFNSDETTYPIQEEIEILSTIKTGKSDELEEKINDFLKSLSKTVFAKDILLKSSLALLMSLYHLCIEKSIETDDIFGNQQLSISSFLKFDSLVSVKARLIELSAAICQKLNQKKNCNKIIEQTLKYIDNNYSRDISLETIANIVFITPSYFCLLFKQTMGINFIDYLQKVRIEKACEMMKKNLHLKTYEIAYKVGYNDEKYFSQLFKKYTSMTPTQYKSTL